VQVRVEKKKEVVKGFEPTPALNGISTGALENPGIPRLVDESCRLIAPGLSALHPLSAEGAAELKSIQTLYPDCLWCFSINCT